MLVAIGFTGARKLKRGARRGAAQHFLWVIALEVHPAIVPVSACGKTTLRSNTDHCSRNTQTRWQTHLPSSKGVAHGGGFMLGGVCAFLAASLAYQSLQAPAYPCNLMSLRYGTNLSRCNLVVTV